MKTNWLQDVTIDKNFQNSLSTFINRYGLSGLEQAMQYYINMQKEYTCKTKTSVSKFKMSDIYYLTIREHNITIYTNHGIYHKYGTLKNELKTLSLYSFVMCNQSCIVSLKKIKSICNNNIILSNNEVLHMSRKYAPKVLVAFSHNNFFNSTK